VNEQVNIFVEVFFKRPFGGVDDTQEALDRKRCGAERPRGPCDVHIGVPFKIFTSFSPLFALGDVLPHTRAILEQKGEALTHQLMEAICGGAKTFHLLCIWGKRLFLYFFG
jgi:hypothetical protein